jgi:hypothetical protein
LAGEEAGSKLEEAKKLFGKDIDISASGTAQVGTATYYHFKCHYDN